MPLDSDVPRVLGEVWTSRGFESERHRFDEQAFGNELFRCSAETIRLRITRDRGQHFVEISPSSENLDPLSDSDGWHDLMIVERLLGKEIGHRFDLEALCRLEQEQGAEVLKSLTRSSKNGPKRS